MEDTYSVVYIHPMALNHCWGYPAGLRPGNMHFREESFASSHSMMKSRLVVYETKAINVVKLLHMF
jgi:hypothetical protein